MRNRSVTPWMSFARLGSARFPMALFCAAWLALAPALAAVAEESCDPGAVNRTVLMTGVRMEQNNAGCVMICYRLVSCQMGCEPTQDSWYEIEDGAAAPVACPPAGPTAPAIAALCI